MQDLGALLGSLVAIDSVNPSLEASGAGEAALAAFVADRLQGAGLDCRLSEVLPGRPNAICRLRGSRPGPVLLWNAHLDTVGVHGMGAPFEPRRADGRLYGRGSADTKAGLAAMMEAAERLAARPDFAGTLVLTGVVDEEYMSQGTEATLDIRADGCVVAEDTALDLVTAHQGFGWYEIETIGRAAHGMHPDVGIDAIARMGRVLEALARFEREVLTADVHPLTGRAVFHNGTIQGGTELGIYPARCLLGIEIGCNPGMRMAERRMELQALLAELGDADKAFGAGLRVVVEREAFEVAPDAAIVRSLEGASRAHGLLPRHRGMNAWMDAALLAAAGIPTVVFGPGGAGHHTDDEWVELGQVAMAADILETAARRFLVASDSPGASACGEEG